MKREITSKKVDLKKRGENVPVNDASDQYSSDMAELEGLTPEERVALFFKDESSAGPQMGDVLGVPDGYGSYWFVPAELKDARSRKKRYDLLRRGYTKLTSASVVRVAGAEVWVCTPEIRALHDKKRLERDSELRRQALDPRI